MPLVFTTVGVALAAAVFGVSMSGAASPRWTVQKFYDRETSHYFADVGAKGPSPDDIYVAQQSLTTLSGQRAGVVNGYGINLHEPFVYFHYTAALTDGTLSIENAI